MEKLKILLLEDEVSDAALIQKVLQRAEIAFDALTVATQKDYRDSLCSASFDVILADNSLPQFNAVEALGILKELKLDTPFILVTGTVSEEFAVNMMREGAFDYILKDRLQRLPGTVRNAVEKQKLEREHRKYIDAVIANEALMKESERLAHTGSWESDLTTYVTRWSDEYYRILDYKPGEIEPSFDNFLKRIHPADLAHVREIINEINPQTQKFSCRIISKNNSLKYIDNEIFITRDSSNKVIKVNGLSRDVTDTVIAQEELHQSEANLRMMMDLVPQLIFARDFDGRYIFVNKSFASLYGLNPDELIAGKINELNPGGMEPDSFLKQDREVIISGKGKVIPDLVITDYQGNERIFHTVKVPFLPIGQQETAVLCIAMEITEQKKAETERMKMVEDIVQRNRDLEQFTQIISHNLRGPVANIIGIANMQKSDDLTDKEKGFLAEGLSIAAANLDGVIRDLNHVTLIKQAISEHKEEVYLPKLLADILISISNQVTDKDITISSDFSAAGTVFTVKNYMHSIFYNLITNSIKYRQPGKPLTIEIRSMLKKDRIVLSFKDNAMGIDLEKKGDQVFGLYKRFHHNAAEGKGMGLFMVKTQVETMGGQIKIQSEVNKGTEFVIELAAAD